MTTKTFYKCIHKKDVVFFVQKANQFSCDIWVEAEPYRMNAKSLLGMMVFDIKDGASLTLTANGFDEERAITELEVFFQTV